MDWPGTPETPNQSVAQRWPGTPEQPSFIGDIKAQAGAGWEKIKQGIAHPEQAGILGAWPGIAQGAAQIIGSPISAAGSAIDRQFPVLKQAEKNDPWKGTIFATPSTADVIGTALGLGGSKVGGAAPAAGAAEATTFKKIFSPGTVSPEAEQAAGGLREASGTAARNSAQTQAALSTFESRINALPPDKQLGILDYMEGRSKGATIPDPSLQSFADEFRKQMELRANKIASTDKLSQAGLVEDYVRHYWTDPKKAEEFVKTWYTKQGSGASLKQRSIPTISEGIKAGLTPLTHNPVEIAMRYVTSMDKYIAMNEMMTAGEHAGTVKFFKLGDRGIPEGWTKLNGHLSQKGMTAAYAPEDWARVWNNYVSPGVYRNQDLGNAYQSFRNASNLTTQSILSFSGYHVMAMAQEAITSEFAKGIGQVIGGTKTALSGLRRGDAGTILRGGKIAAKGAGSTAGALTAPVTSYLKGKKFQNVYLGRTSGSPDFRSVVDTFTKAGGRGTGKLHAPDYQFSNGGSYFSAWKRGSLKMELRGALKEIADSKFPPYEIARHITSAIGRSFETIMDPLFKEYIPMLKNGAFSEGMRSWLEMNPQAGYDEQMAFARKLVDSIDNRFGEMIQDNIFWHTLMKQTATLGMLSYSWNLGSLRLATGAADILKTAGKALDPTSKTYSPNASWIIGFPMAVATMNGIYQYLKTGQPPKTANDLVFPPTGGKAPGFGGRGQVPERAMLPGYEKEPFGWYYNGTKELENKLNPLVRMGWEAMNNSDWRNDPIVRPDPTVPQWLHDYFTFVLGSLNPISLGRFGQGEMHGSAMGKPEEFLGIRPAPQYGEDPEGYARGMSAIEKKRWLLKQEHDRATQRKYGGPQQ